MQKSSVLVQLPKDLNEFSPLAIPGNKRSTTVALASILSLAHCTQHNLPDVVDLHLGLKAFVYHDARTLICRYNFCFPLTQANDAVLQIATTH